MLKNFMHLWKYLYGCISFAERSVNILFNHLKTYFMLPEKIMQSDLLDLLFENRNKTYGAYALRRSYNKTMASAITVTLFIALAFCIFQFMHHTKPKDFIREINIPDPELTRVVPVEPQPKAPAPKAVATHVNQNIYSAPVIVKDNDDTKMPTVDDLDKNLVSDKNIVGDGQVDIIQPPSNTAAGLGTEAVQPVVKADDAPLRWAQVMPEYPGGLEALKKFMLRNLRQPDDLEAGEKIIVMASFIVNKNGQIEQVKIITGGRPDLNQEVQRVINKMPSWKPGIQNGNTVAVYFNLPVTFMSEE
jgi:periplasmic protein TonB